MSFAPVETILKVTQAFDSLGIRYLIGGSVASMVHGIPRLTRDVDFAAEIRPEHVAPLVRALEGEFYIDAEMIRDAIRHNASFNVIHLETMDKADVFVFQPTAWGEAQMERRRLETLDPAQPEATVYFSGPEDNILNKLQWYRMGGGVSDRQWNDVLGVLKVQAGALDLDYLRHWAAELGLTDLLDRALEDAGLR